MSGGASDKTDRRSFRKDHSLRKGRISAERIFRCISADDRRKGRNDDRIDLFTV